MEDEAITQVQSMFNALNEGEKEKLIEKLKKRMLESMSGEARVRDIIYEFECAHEIMLNVVWKHVDKALEDGHELDLCLVSDLCGTMMKGKVW
jgi:hypothetical protein